jgi:hypothetical protein
MQAEDQDTAFLEEFVLPGRAQQPLGVHRQGLWLAVAGFWARLWLPPGTGAVTDWPERVEMETATRPGCILTLLGIRSIRRDMRWSRPLGDAERLICHSRGSEKEAIGGIEIEHVVAQSYQMAVGKTSNHTRDSDRPTPPTAPCLDTTT